MLHYTDSLAYFAKYQWILRMIEAKEAEKRQIRAKINAGFVTRDSLDENWESKLDASIEEEKKKLKEIEFVIASLPETNELLPCKLFLRLYYVAGCTLTETAQNMNVSETTLRRIRKRTSDYFEKYPVG